MAKLRKNEYWAILDWQGKFMLDDGDQPILRKTRGELVDWAGFHSHLQ